MLIQTDDGLGPISFQTDHGWVVLDTKTEGSQTPRTHRVVLCPGGLMFFITRGKTREIEIPNNFQLIIVVGWAYQ